MKTLYNGGHNLDLQDDNTYDLVIPNDIGKLGYECSGSIPDKIRNVIVGSNTTGEGESTSYSFNNLTKANVIYDGEDTQAPWGAKSLNGVDATYTPYIMGAFSTYELNITDSVEQFYLMLGDAYPKIIGDKLKTGNYIISSLTAKEGQNDVTSKVLEVIEFSDQPPVYDFNTFSWNYDFNTKAGAIVDSDINNKLLNIRVTLQNINDNNETYTWTGLGLTISQTSTPVLPGNPLNVTLQGSMDSSAGYETANVSIDNSCNYLTISLSTNRPIDSARISDKSYIHSNIAGVITGDNDNIVTFTIPTAEYISGGISSIAFEFNLSGSNFTPEGPVIEATQLQTYDPSNYFDMSFYDNGGTITAGKSISTPISTGIKVTLYANNVSTITSASATDYDYTETINGTIDSVNNTVEFNLPTSMYSYGDYTMNITIAYSGTAPVFNERCKWEEVSS